MTVNRELGTICWPHHADLAPGVCISLSLIAALVPLNGMTATHSGKGYKDYQQKQHGKIFLVKSLDALIVR